MGLIVTVPYAPDSPITSGGQNFNENAIKNVVNGNIENVNIKSNAAIAASKLNLATIAQAVTMSSVIFKLAKGADVASATTTTLGDDGNFFDITGTTTITSITAKVAGTVVYLQFDGILQVTDGSNLKLNGNLTTAAQSTLTLVSDGTNWFEVSRQPTGTQTFSGYAIQTVNTQSGAVATSSTAIPFDDTIPQQTEGGEVFTKAITPSSTSNKLHIQVTLNVESAQTQENITVALFQDATAGALAACAIYSPLNGFIHQLTFSHFMTAGTASATTFKVRVGNETGTVTINGVGGSRKLGGVLISGITITEIAA